MLSGSLPRGNSRTPLSGKIGRIAGSAAVPLGCSLIGSSLSGKHHRRKSPAAAEGQWIGRTHDLEKLDQLLARRLLVPLAIPLEEGQQLVNRGFSVAAAKQRC